MIRKDSTTAAKPSTKTVHRPAVVAVAAIATGILIDDVWATHNLLWWCTAAALASAALGLTCLLPRRLPVLSSWLVLMTLLSLGGLRHQQLTQLRLEDNVLTIATVEPQPVRIAGTVCTSVDMIESERGPRIPPWMQVDTSRFDIESDSLFSGLDRSPLSGRVRVDVTGHLVHVQVGDRVELLGQLVEPGPVLNPGGFDFARYLRRQQIDALLRVQHPSAVRLTDRASPVWWPLRIRESIREQIRSLCIRHLAPDSASIAISILLGDRSRLSDEQRDRFIQSGTMHLLAISGLHVGILAGLIAGCGRLVNFHPRTLSWMVVAGVWSYVLLTNHRPPVLRASILISILIWGLSQGRRIDGFNLLAACAGCLLLWRPTDLFDVGFQLSFLAVGAIVWTGQANWRPFQLRPKSGVPLSEGWRWIESLRPCLDLLAQGYLVTAAIWLATLPLTISTFHVVSPIGFLLNVILIPYVAIVLGCGYLFLLSGLMLPLVTPWLAAVFDSSIQALLWCTDAARQLPYGYFYASTIAEWWMIGFYVLLAWVWGLTGQRWGRRWSWKLLVVWIVCGLVWGPLPQQEHRFQMTILSVGHGLATVIQLPTGETILYDAGTMGDGRRAERAVEQFMWQAGIDHLDAIIVSHADHDHFSGMFGLLERHSVGTLIVSRQFLDFEQSGVAELCDLAAQRSIPIRIVEAGDQIAVLGKTQPTQMVVQHPHRDFHSKSDNANSIVLGLQYAGRRLLLTGDLEKDGLDVLLNDPTPAYDVILAPHHGSRYSHPSIVAEWGRPQYFIVSSGDHDVQQRLSQELNASCQVFCTANSGAMTITINAAGELQVAPFLPSVAP